MCAKVANVGTRIWFDQFNLSGFLNAAEQGVRQELIPCTCFSDTGPRRLVDGYDHSHSHNGFFDAETLAGITKSFDKAIWDTLDLDTSHYLAHLWGGSSEGGVVYESMVKLSGQPRSGGQGGAVLLNLAAEGSDGISRALILRNATITGNGNGTGRQVGATTLGQRFQVVIRVFSGTFTGFTAKIQESQNDGGADLYADIAGMSQAIAAAGVWRLTTTAATEAWKRLVIGDWVGTNAVIGVTAGVVAGS